MTSLAYHAMRMRWCRLALWAFVRRWFAYLITGAGIVVIGMAGGVADAIATVQALCAWLVLPLFRAVNEPVWIVPAVVLQALVGAGLVWGMRPLLWPVRWAAAERALPLTRRELLMSDARVVPLGLLPWALPCAIGAQALIARHPGWLQPGRAVSALVVALLGSVALGVALLQWLRRPHRARPIGVPRWSESAPLRPTWSRSSATVVRTAWPSALMWLPLWRGPARRSGHALLLGSTLLCVPAAGVLRWPGAAPWCLAAYALVALLVVTRLASLLRLELTPLLQACTPLPLAMRPVARARNAAALLPLPVSGLLLIASLPSSGVRPAVLSAYVVACLGSCALEAGLSTADPGSQSSRWLFCLVLMLALASEVMR